MKKSQNGSLHEIEKQMIQKRDNGISLDLEEEKTTSRDKCTASKGYLYRGKNLLPGTRRSLNIFFPIKCILQKFIEEIHPIPRQWYDFFQTRCAFTRSEILSYRGDFSRYSSIILLTRELFFHNFIIPFWKVSLLKISLFNKSK